MRRSVVVLSLVAIVGLALAAPGGSAVAKVHRSASARVRQARIEQLRRLLAHPNGRFYCEMTRMCRDFYDSREITGHYIGHDEPNVYFTDTTAGSGNDMTYQVTLPKNPPTLPTQDGTGGTWNFQLRPTFWFGLTLCDSQSAPEYTHTCVADSDANIKNKVNPKSKDYVGRHAGNAYMELQFYAPGWIGGGGWLGASCTATQYCAALTIDSLSFNQNERSIKQNSDCLQHTFMAGVEPVNLAYVTTSGVSQAPANPVALSSDPKLTGLLPDLSQDLLMNPGDRLSVHIFDTSDGIQVAIDDLTSGATGSMTASKANGFGQVMFKPNAAHCTARPYAFHPEFSSAVARGLSWSWPGNVAVSDEIGHFEYCDAVAKDGGKCTQAGASDPGGLDKDDRACFSGATSTLVDITGCFGTDVDFDGVSYQNDWPGSISDPTQDQLLHASPLSFTSPVFGPSGTNYAQASMETDLPVIEPAKTCDLDTGAGCANPPPGAAFYPFYSIGSSVSGCDWIEGGPFLPGTMNTFGGSSTTAYGSLFKVWFPEDHWTSEAIYPVFINQLGSNPCPQS